MLIDPFGRAITYLRISVTDRCNLRCVYCMPTDGIAWQSHENILRFEEIAALVKVAASHGVREVRLTGGEPLVRSGLTDLVALIAAIPGIEDISLTTNGLLLEKMAGPLAAAGLKRINVSLDTLDPEKYLRITRGGSLEKVWAGIEAAERAGLQPIKINTVAMRGVNEDELVELARMTLTHPWQMRFIELMPVNNQATWGEGFPAPENAYLPVSEIHQRLERLGLKPVKTGSGLGPASEFQIPGALGTIGIISPLGEQFCGDCNRLRLTADGHLRPCLLSDIEIPVREALRNGDPILPLLEQAVLLKPAGHELSNHVSPTGRCMMQIGG
jgi:GTP 3',8-cyclase